MADEILNEDGLLAKMPTGIANAITAQTLRDLTVSVRNLVGTGWANYVDAQYTSGSPLALSAGVRTKIPNNKGHPTTDETHLPYDATSWWNSTTNKFLPTNTGDAYTLRFNFQTQTTVVDASLRLALDIDGTIGEIWNQTFTYPRGANTTHAASFSIPLFIGETFISNGGEFYAIATSNSTIWDIQFVVIRNYKA